MNSKSHAEPVGTTRSLAIKAKLDDYAELAKVRIALMVVITAGVGYAFGASSGWTLGSLIAALIGTALSSMGSGALNQLYERDTDGMMDRTKNRPLPGGRMSAREAAMVGGALLAAGLLVLVAFTTTAAAVACVFTAGSYLVVYTPLKRVAWWSMHVGAVPGAMPPVIGYAAASGEVPVEAWALFAIMAIWQVPHFLAIAWLYRTDYAKAGLPMLPVMETDGKRTFRQTLIGSVLLLPAGLWPWYLGMAGPWYAAAATALGVWFLWLAVKLMRKADRASARKLFFASLIYLPVVLVAMVVDRP